MSNTPSSTPASNPLRTIIIGVSTTVLGSAAVYFLGFHNKGNNNSPDNFLLRKEATTTAWNSYKSYENLYFKNVSDLFQHVEPSDESTPANIKISKLNTLEDDVLKEVDNFVSSIEKIKNKPSLDDDFVSLVERRIKIENDAAKKMKSYFENFRSILQNSYGDEWKTKLTDEMTRMGKEGQVIVDRAKREITDISKTLSDKYGQQYFATTDFLLFKDEKNTTFTNTNTNVDNTNGGTAGKIDNVYVNNNNNSGTTGNNYNTVSASSLSGNWETEAGPLYIEMNSSYSGYDGSFEWRWNTGDAASRGVWRIQNNNQLYLYTQTGYNANLYMLFNISNVAANSFTMQLTTNSAYTYYARRVTNY